MLVVVQAEDGIRYLVRYRGLGDGYKRQILEREALLGDEAPEAAAGELTLTRDLRREGRSACRVNGQLVSLAILREIGQQVVDVPGQSEHPSLLRVREPLYLLERFAALEGERGMVG